MAAMTPEIKTNHEDCAGDRCSIQRPSERFGTTRFEYDVATSTVSPV